MKGQRVYTKERSLLNKTVSMTLLTSLVGKTPIIIDFRKQTNTQWDFAQFVYWCCKEAHLVRGDYLVVDNVAIHCATASMTVMIEILQTFGIHLIFIPAYSPELNACEFVFAEIKKKIRR
eukprot:TRINITY_DN8642_c0_g1_i1.p2 TRINITY_DN8642_c0_g1~~TRINITY_DN8642_c0_g1_i1.p2  ORF type:complete len:120 (-),score=21.74 TRINITY_DN8642_c0_g1_i1:50-409(-)